VGDRLNSSPVRRPVRLSAEHLRELQDAFTPLSIERGRHGSRLGATGMAVRRSSACENVDTPGGHRNADALRDAVKMALIYA